MNQLLRSRQSGFTREQYRMLLEVAEAIAAHRDLDSLFQDLARRLPRIVPFDYINLVLHDASRNSSKTKAATASRPRSRPAACACGRS